MTPAPSLRAGASASRGRPPAGLHGPRIFPFSRLAIPLCAVLAFEGCAAPPDAPAGAGLCWIAGPHNGFLVLDARAPNLETCGARLEVVHLLERGPVRGAYGGVFVVADDAGLFARAPNGPESLLFDPASRRILDADIKKLLALRGGGSLDLRPLRRPLDGT